ncbi:putative CBS domain, CNNM, transmembrane domain-containing protein [Helianthus anomalus]
MKYLSCCSLDFFFHVAVVTMIVLFAGMMSGLTLGLMSMSLVDLEVLAASGKPVDRLRACMLNLFKHIISLNYRIFLVNQKKKKKKPFVDAAKILSVVKRHHLVLCTLLISNATAMEALPIFLNKLVPELGAIIISVTLILLFGEIIPQSICTRYGLVIGAAVTPLVRVLVWIWFPVAYPISKVLDCILGKGHVSLFRRAELKTLVDFHGNKAGKGGSLSLHETTIIGGALELTSKTARDAMTPLSETFSVDIDAKLDKNLMNLIIEKGYSRVPVYYDQPGNIVGALLVKNLMTINPADCVPIKNITLRLIPRVSDTMPLYDILNEFQKGLSHIAVVIQHPSQGQRMQPSISKGLSDVRLDILNESYQSNGNGGLRSRSMFHRFKSVSGSGNVSRAESSKSRRWSDKFLPEVVNITDKPFSSFRQEGEVIGIITMEDVMEELINDEIFDETDHHNE